MLFGIAKVFIKLIVVGMNLPVGATTETHLFGPVSPGFAFDRAAVSWNVEGIQRCRLEVSAKVDSSPWESLWRWPSRGAAAKQVSCHQARDLYLRVSVSGTGRATIRMITAAFEQGSGGGQGAPNLESEEPSLGRLAYGEVGGNPGARLLAAYLHYWSYTLGREDLSLGVGRVQSLLPARPTLPDLASAAGSILGVRAYVSFFHSLDDITAWTRLAPVWCVLPEPVLVEGFSRSGDVDALVPVQSQLRRVSLNRQAFDRKWSVSGRQVLIVQPKGLDTPAQNRDSPAWIHFHFEPSSPAPRLPEGKGSTGSATN